MPPIKIEKLTSRAIEREMRLRFNLGMVYSSTIAPKVLPDGETEGNLNVDILGEKMIYSGGLHIYKTNDGYWTISPYDYTLHKN